MAIEGRDVHAPAPREPPVNRKIARLLDLAMATYNAGVRSVRAVLHLRPPGLPDPDIMAVRARAARGSDISSHLESLFVEGLKVNPRLIVELGVRGGESTWVFERLARRCGADLVSVDIADCSAICKYERWHFVQEDDVQFGRRFPNWCRTRGLTTRIDVLFVDTSHLYQHTLAEIAAWFPHLGPGAAVMFHDTNAGTIFRRRDWTLGGHGFNNDRGVIRALEKTLGLSLVESRPFDVEAAGWRVTHDPVCNGLTILRQRGGRKT